MKHVFKKMGVTGLGLVQSSEDSSSGDEYIVLRQIQKNYFILIFRIIIFVR